MSIQFKHVSKSYRIGSTTYTVLRDLSIAFQSGQFHLILGQSGSGKSTLLNLISGIDHLDQGEIWFQDRAVSTLKEPDITLLRRQKIGIVYQFFNLIPSLTAFENIALPLELAGTHPREIRSRVDHLLAAVSLVSRAQSRPDQLSGGEQQRVAIARALIHEPDLILADEPTGNLDAATGEQVLELLLQLSREAGKTLIMVSHNQELARRADHVYHMQHQQLQIQK